MSKSSDDVRGPCLFPSCRGQCGSNEPCGPTEKTGGWQPMETAPKDRREILVRQHNGCCYEHYIVWWTSFKDCDYPWIAHVNAYAEDRFDEWHEIPA